MLFKCPLVSVLLARIQVFDHFFMLFAIAIAVHEAIRPAAAGYTDIEASTCAQGIIAILSSGEGPTDLGVCADGDSQCDAENYNYGPMTVIVSQIVELRHEYSLLDSECFGFVSKSALADRTSELKSEKKKETNFPGKKRRRETLHFFNNARVLARIAKERESELNDEVIAVLFRDSDHQACPHSPGGWEAFVNSLSRGSGFFGSMRYATRSDTLFVGSPQARRGILGGAVLRNACCSSDCPKKQTSLILVITGIL